eukprot:COSAG02_NODE_1219_length_13812_cov_108.713629_4_plen_161_part_00
MGDPPGGLDLRPPNTVGRNPTRNSYSRVEGLGFGSKGHIVKIRVFVTELCVLRRFGGVDFSLIFICAQSVPEFLWDRLRASIQFPVIPKRAQYARLVQWGECSQNYGRKFWYGEPGDQGASDRLNSDFGMIGIFVAIPRETSSACREASSEGCIQYWISR